MPGMLLHIDGSKHRWLNDDRWYDLIVILDDATSEIYYAQLVEEESTRTVMAGLREVIENKGLFCALYSDRGSHFFVTLKAGEKVDKHRLTQVGRAMKELGVQMIRGVFAASARPVGAQLRNLAGAAAAGTAPGGDQRVGGGQPVSAGALHRGVQRASSACRRRRKGTAFRRTARTDLNWIFTVQTERVVAKDNTVAIGERLWQIDKTRFRSTLAGSTVTIHEHLDETVSIRYGPHVVGRFDSERKKAGSAQQPKSAVEKAGAWKPAKTKNVVNDRIVPVAPSCLSFSQTDERRGGGRTGSDEVNNGYNAYALLQRCEKWRARHLGADSALRKPCNRAAKETTQHCALISADAQQVEG